MLQQAFSWVKKGIDYPARLFLILAVSFGSLFVFLIPPFQAPDEPTHFYRAFQISEGGLISKKLTYGTGGFLPSSLVEITQPFNHLIFNPLAKTNHPTIRQALSKPLDPARRQEVRFENTSLYPPVSYIPQSLGISLVRLLGGGPLTMLYFARLFNLAAWIALIFLAIKKLPTGHYAAVAFALLPMSLFQAASVSGDVITTSLSFLLTALLFASMVGGRPINNGGLFIITATAISLAFCKLPYFLIALLVWVVPARRFGSVRRYFTWSAGITLAVMLLGTVWSLAARSVFVNLREVANEAAQLQFIISHPLTYVIILGRTFFSTFSDPLLIQVVGLLGWLDTKLPIWTTLAAWLAVALGLLKGSHGLDSEAKFAPIQKLASAVIGVSIVGIITTLLYLTWNSVGAKYVEGLQGRYFIPLAFLVLSQVPNNLRLNNSSIFTRNKMVVILLTTILTSTSIVLYFRYWPS